MRVARRCVLRAERRFVMSVREIRIFPDVTAIAAEASNEWSKIAPKSVALAGGSTPRTLYQLLSTRKDLDWGATKLFWGDERHVPPDHEDSNYRMAKEALLSHIDIPETNVFRIEG